MRVLCAPCSFKGALSAGNAAAAIGRGVTAAGHVAVLRPLADGGEGTLDVLLDVMGGTAVDVDVRGARGQAARARLGLLHDGATAVVEIAQAVGLPMIAAADRDVLASSTEGVGDLVRAALDRGARRVWITLGGSGTVDGGAGMLIALGARIVDESGAALSPTPRALPAARRIVLDDLDPRVRGVELIGLCDVGSPLSGARAFMAQKGAVTTEQQDLLEAGLRALHGDVAVPGAGAAGGLGAAILALGGALVSGAGFVLSACGTGALLDDVDLAITGEGSLDAQTSEGKAIAALAGLAATRGVPVVALCGVVDGEGPPGVVASFAIGTAPRAVDDAIARTERDLERAARSVVRLCGRRPP